MFGEGRTREARFLIHPIHRVTTAVDMLESKAMLDMVRWQLNLGWPKGISSQGGILVDREPYQNPAG